MPGGTGRHLRKRRKQKNDDPIGDSSLENTSSPRTRSSTHTQEPPPSTTTNPPRTSTRVLKLPMAASTETEKKATRVKPRKTESKEKVAKQGQVITQKENLDESGVSLDKGKNNTFQESTMNQETETTPPVETAESKSPVIDSLQEKTYICVIYCHPGSWYF